MRHVAFTYWQDGEYYLGFMNDYPDYEAQGLSLDELSANLKDMLIDLESKEVPYIRHISEIVIA